MAKTRVAINGFGRIGRNAFKIAFERDDLEIVAVNDLTDNETLAHLLKHDTNYGTYEHPVEATEQGLSVNDIPIAITSEPDPAKLPWSELDVDVVVESTGRFSKPEQARAHIEAGAKKVVVSAPIKGAGGTTVVLGVNDADLDSGDEILSNASCTTNCITPPAAVMEANFGIQKAMMTTTHSYTADQNLQDGPHRDLRRARAAAENIVPTTTGAAIAAAEALPQLEGIFDGMAIRVPTSVVSLCDFTFLLKRETTAEEINDVFREAAGMPMYQGILAVSEEPLVSSDFIGNSYSSIVDLEMTKVVDGDMAKVVAWYDNEWGYSNRLVEMVADLGRLMSQ